MHLKDAIGNSVSIGLTDSIRLLKIVCVSDGVKNEYVGKHSTAPVLEPQQCATWTARHDLDGIRRRNVDRHIAKTRGSMRRDA
jgi:hypothetical protein